MSIHSACAAVALASLVLAHPAAALVLSPTAPLYGPVLFEARYERPGMDLDRVLIRGEREWTTICIGYECRRLLKSSDGQSLRGHLQDMGASDTDAQLIAKIVKMSACTVLPTMPPYARQATAASEETYRQAVGSQIIDAHASNLRMIVTRKQVFTVLYSDGSQEDFIYASIYSRHKPVEGSFKPGSGVAGSACTGEG